MFQTFSVSMDIPALCGSYFPVKGQEVVERRIERNSWLMSSWLFHPSFLLCSFSSFWHLGKACCFTGFAVIISSGRLLRETHLSNLWGKKMQRENIGCDPCSLKQFQIVRIFFSLPFLPETAWVLFLFPVLSFSHLSSSILSRSSGSCRIRFVL